MALNNLAAESNPFNDILDEEFNRYLEITRMMMKQLKNPADRHICAKYIRKCTNLDAPSIEIKRNRNAFFKYFLKMLHTASTTQPPQYDDWFKPKKMNVKDKASVFFSDDKRTYVAAKAIPGYGALVYLAVSYKPELGWQQYGFSEYRF